MLLQCDSVPYVNTPCYGVRSNGLLLLLLPMCSIGQYHYPRSLDTLSFKCIQRCTFATTSFFCAPPLFVCCSPTLHAHKGASGSAPPLCSAHEAGNLGLDIAQAECTRGGMHRPFPPQLHVNGGLQARKWGKPGGGVGMWTSSALFAWKVSGASANSQQFKQN